MNDEKWIIECWVEISVGDFRQVRSSSSVFWCLVFDGILTDEANAPACNFCILLK